MEPRVLRTGLAVEWRGAPGVEYVDTDLSVGHPGRVTDETFDYGYGHRPEDVEDVFVEWMDLPHESGAACHPDEIEVISDEEFSIRVERVRNGLPPL